MNTLRYKILAMLLILSYGYLALGSVFMLSHHNIPMMDCPYMGGQQTLCTMNMREHVDIWKTMTTSILYALYIFIPFVFVWSVYTIHNSSPPLVRQFLYYKKNNSNPFVLKENLYFFKGVFNPKPY